MKASNINSTILTGFGHSAQYEIPSRDKYTDKQIVNEFI